jgi:hypothetical protein
MSVHVLRTIEPDTLEIFKAVVDSGGVTRAAAQAPSRAFKRHDAIETTGGGVAYQVVSSPESKTPAFDRRNGSLIQKSHLEVSWNLGLTTRSSPASLPVLELLWYLIRSFARCARSATSAFYRYRLSLQMPRRFWSGLENIILLLSMLGVANWLKRTSAKSE